MTKANIYSSLSLHMYARNSQKDLFKEYTMFNVQAKNVVCKLIHQKLLRTAQDPTTRKWKICTQFT